MRTEQTEAEPKHAHDVHAGAPSVEMCRRRDRHRQAVLEAETRRVENELGWSGPLERGELERRCGGRRWREGGFDAAVRHGVDTGRIKALPLGYLALVRRWLPRQK